MKKVAIVANSTWNIYNFRLHLIHQLYSQGYHVTIITPTDTFLPLVYKNVSVLHIPLQKLLPQSKNPINDLSLLYELYKIYKREKFELILHYTIKPNIYGSIAARWVGIPCISTLTGLGYTFLNNFRITRLVKSLYKFALKDTTKIIFHNTDDRNLFVKLNLIKENKAKVIKGSGINTSFFQFSKKKKNKDHFIFLFIGRLLYDKGIMEFLDAAKKISLAHNQINFWIVGSLDSSNPSSIPKEKIDQFTKNNKITYFGETNTIKNYIDEADVIVLPSYREGMPKAILEGMSMGRPVITTDTPGCREAIDNQINGFLVPIKDSDALSHAMLKMYQLRAEELQEMGKRSREKVIAEFDEKIITNQYVNLIRKRIG